MLGELIFLVIVYQCSAVLVPNNDSNLDHSTLSVKYPLNNVGIPTYFDWRYEDHAVTPVKDQGDCNAGWAFSVIANIESQLKINKNDNRDISEQFLIDCDFTQCGCTNGSIISAFSNIVINFGGVLLEEDYPFRNIQRLCILSNPLPYLVKVTGFKRVEGNEDEMAKMLYKFGPLSAAINSESMKRYKGNYIDEPSDADCNPANLDHSILIVGYNVFIDHQGRETQYWIIKNSWGKDWGDKGFYYLVRGQNACGIASEVSFALVQ